MSSKLKNDMPKNDVPSFDLTGQGNHIDLRMEKDPTVIKLDDSEDPKKMSKLKKYLIIFVIFTAGSSSSASCHLFLLL